MLIDHGTPLTYSSLVATIGIIHVVLHNDYSVGSIGSVGALGSISSVNYSEGSGVFADDWFEVHITLFCRKKPMIMKIMKR